MPNLLHVDEGCVASEGTGYKQLANSPWSKRAACWQGLTVKARNHSWAA